MRLVPAPATRVDASQPLVCVRRAKSAEASTRLSEKRVRLVPIAARAPAASCLEPCPNDVALNEKVLCALRDPCNSEITVRDECGPDFCRVCG